MFFKGFLEGGGSDVVAEDLPLVWGSGRRPKDARGQLLRRSIEIGVKAKLLKRTRFVRIKPLLLKAFLPSEPLTGVK
jgi:hypothetical protein